MNIRTILIALVAVAMPVTGALGQSVARIWNEELLDAIRRDVPNPPGHARNLHHTAMAMYNAWAAYSTTAVGYQFNEKVSPLPVDIELARHEAISYAAYRVLRSRFAASVGAGTTLPSLDATLTGLGYSTSFGQGAVTSGTTPAEVGRRIGQMVLSWGLTDGFSNTTHPQAYNSSVNPNMSVPMSVLGTNVNFQPNMPLGYGIPSGTDPNLWQPLDLSTGVTQNGIPIPGGPQSFVGVQGLSTKAFSLTRPSNLVPWIDIGPPSKLSTTGSPSSTDALYKAGGIDVLQKSAALNDTGTIDISPASWGNNPIGTESGTGYPTNPVTGGTYTANNVPKGDFYRVLAEYWADGPHSETPPGHWHVIANQVADMPGFSKRLRGTGPVVNDLEWDVKTYMSLAGSVHDAACAAWSLKRYYSGQRPITMIRHMCTKGQSSNPSGPSYHSEGIPLQTDVVEVITAATAGSGGKHQSIWSVALNSYQPGTNYIGQIAVKSWPGEHPNNPPASSGLPATNQSTVRWMLGRDWLPFQRKTFNTPAFPGYISGHSTFSRAAAEALALITGSPYFPGGFHHHTYLANTMQIDLGPSVDIDLQWASYYDAADQAGASRRFGGIHPVEDDLPARIVGSTAGITAFTKAEKFWLGTIQSETVIPLVTIQPNGDALITWTQTLGRYYKLQESTNFSTWTDSAERIFATSTSGSFTDTAPAAGIAYRIIEVTPSVARVWNELLLGAIRRDVPNPPGHARNIFHTAAAMYNAWAAYHSSSVGFVQNEKISPLPSDIEAARHQAISYAAYRVLRTRFLSSIGAGVTLPQFDAQMTAFGYSPSTAQAALTSLTTPAELGKRCGQAVLTWSTGDQFTNTTYPQAYTTAVNPNMDPNLSLSVLGNNGEFPTHYNMPLGVGIPTNTDPNFWQPLALSASVTQNGIPTPGGIQGYVGVQGLATLPFSLTRDNPVMPWIDLYGGPSKLSVPGSPSSTDSIYKEGALSVIRASSELNSTTTINISPGAIGNNTLGNDDGTGFATNPITGLPYPTNNATKGDYYRVLAEFWADGPHSETPPGHWQVLANEVTDDPAFVKQLRGSGPVLNDLEWDVKTYFTLASATHDAACAAWALKRYYSGTRPITMIRYMGTRGQSSNPSGPSYHSQGLPLETDVCEVITAATTATGGKHESIWDMYTHSYQPGAWHIGEIAVKSWPAEHPDNPAASTGQPAIYQSTVRWMLAKDWVPFQRKTFNTPAFPGYISGHSTFSRAAAEALTLLTGTPNFPGGFHHHTYAANSMLIDLGPAAPVDLQWCTYYDAADQAGQSRRWGGIHVPEDDYHGRVIGAEAGTSAATLAFKYFDGSILTEALIPEQIYGPSGTVTLTCPMRRGLYCHWEYSTDLQNWTALTTTSQATATTITTTDTAPAGIRRFYRVRYDAAP